MKYPTNPKWVVFSLNGVELARYTIKGTFEGEMASTVELLAVENHCDKREITIKTE